MIHFDLPKQKSSIIKVIGVGGGGSNAVNFMHSENIEGVDFIVCNTDAKALEQSKIVNKIQLGPHLTQGLGAGANPEVGKKATEESLQEIKSILEVNTKMAFITAGMGGGTGTGGAPIVAKICQELNILTVGIVTTPFGFEGPRRMKQAEEGLKQLQPYVDTLLVISNDKLRMQYGNLKMREAFQKADNVLATAAKCITDIINSKGHIIVDFADVCTVMKNGGVAILGKAEVEGEDRASRAIEEALTSPLLNDNEIKGARWILININSAEGDNECTMDEIEIINNYLRMQAGENTDVIMGTGYDNSLDRKIGITLIATGFDHKDPFVPVEEKNVEAANKPEKIVLQLGVEGEENKLDSKNDKLPHVADPFAPKLSEPLSAPAPELSFPQTDQLKDPSVIHFQLNPEMEETKKKPVMPEKDQQEIDFSTGYADLDTNIRDMKLTQKQENTENTKLNTPDEHFVYHESPASFGTPTDDDQTSHFPPKAFSSWQDSEGPSDSGTHNDELSEEDRYGMPLREMPSDEEAEQRRRAEDRIRKLRNLSFNMNSSEQNNEFDAVPAYVRKNMELFGNANSSSSADSYYSKYTVDKDDQEKTHISSLNSFLDGKKPD